MNSALSSDLYTNFDIVELILKDYSVVSVMLVLDIMFYVAIKNVM
jgi:hypothetical protein